MPYRRERRVSESRPLAHKGFEEAEGLRTHRDGDSWIVDKKSESMGSEVRWAMVQNSEGAKFGEILVVLVWGIFCAWAV
jgi:hypothetical protein